MKTVYALTNSWYAECGNDSGIVAIFTTKERALAEMEKCIAGEIKDNDDLFENGESKDGIIVERGKDSWCAFEEGYYLSNSCEYCVTEEIIYE